MISPTDLPLLPLHLHSNWSVLDGASPIEDYVDYAASNGLGVCSCTDHGYLMGIYGLVSACKKKGVTPIPGLEIYLHPGEGHQVRAGKQKVKYYHLTLWAINAEGWESLRTLSNLSWGEGRVVKAFGASKPRVTWEELGLHNRGLVCGTGCLLGPVCRPIMDGDLPGSVRNLRKLLEIFGNDRLYAEIMPNRITHEFNKGTLIQVDTEDGFTLSFLPEDKVVVGTTGDEITAREAFDMKVSSLGEVDPRRACERGEAPDQDILEA